VSENHSADKLYSGARCAAWIGLIVNVLLGVAKLAGVLAGGSFALVADAINSLGNVQYWPSVATKLGGRER